MLRADPSVKNRLKTPFHLVSDSQAHAHKIEITFPFLWFVCFSYEKQTNQRSEQHAIAFCFCEYLFFWRTRIFRSARAQQKSPGGGVGGVLDGWIEVLWTEAEGKKGRRAGSIKF